MYTDAQFLWSAADLASTGASTKVFDGAGLKTCQRVTITIETLNAVDTAVVGIEHARTSTSPFGRIGGSTGYALASSGAAESVTVSLDGPFCAIRPYLISRTASTTPVIVSLTAC